MYFYTQIYQLETSYRYLMQNFSNTFILTNLNSGINFSFQAQNEVNNREASSKIIESSRPHHALQNHKTKSRKRKRSIGKITKNEQQTVKQKYQQSIQSQIYKSNSDKNKNLLKKLGKDTQINKKQEVNHQSCFFQTKKPILNRPCILVKFNQNLKSPIFKVPLRNFSSQSVAKAHTNLSKTKNIYTQNFIPQNLANNFRQIEKEGPKDVMIKMHQRSNSLTHKVISPIKSYSLTTRIVSQIILKPN